MNWDQVQGRWKEMTGNIRSEWGELTDDEIAEAKGDREALEGQIQKKYGKSKEEARKDVDRWLAKQ